ncbi:MAG: tRNA glutamyl-Q(34) synthetase GluQRS [Planctomycetota bacterium]|nr:MAG: tRNA glutamyl-Q(34) synthetase GluQRS [Planctomycetota bacterium]
MSEQPSERNRLPVGRLAPSPTGAQHVGNARTYLIAWLSIRARSGRVILRIEDIDSPRVKPWAVQQSMDDLRWLGLDWDEGPDLGGPQAPYIQTERCEHYIAVLQQWQMLERVYPCTCTRSDIAAAASAPHFGQEGPRYPGTCSGRRVRDAAALTEPYVWRWRASDRLWQLHDQFAGESTCRVDQDLGDFIVAKKDGSPAYQLAVVVDDHAMGITEVCRGDDLLPSAFRQLELYASLGWPSPEFTHVPLVVGSDGRRLAKRHGDTRLSQLREAGVSPERLVGLLAHSCGWQARPDPISSRELLSRFQLGLIPPAPWEFTEPMWRELLR